MENDKNFANISEEYRPISMWGYFGYQLLFSIPCVGFILLLVFSFGGAKNYNVRNFARSYFCFLIVIVVLVLLLSLTGGFSAILGGSASYDFNPISEEQKVEAMAEFDGEKVYWTPFGKVYHIYEDCYVMNRMDTITEGTVEQAIAANRTRLCTYCEKRRSDE